MLLKLAAFVMLLLSIADFTIEVTGFNDPPHIEALGPR